MRTLIIGFLLFAAWAALSVYLYVNKIRDFTPEPAATVQTDTIAVAPVAEQPKAVMPEKMVVYFESDKSAFNPDSQTQTLLEAFRTWIDQNPGSGINITGHADASGSNKYNMELGQKRALSVKEYLVNKGVAADKITTGSRGEEEPVADNNTPEGKAKNRRSEIIIK